MKKNNKKLISFILALSFMFSGGIKANATVNNDVEPIEKEGNFGCHLTFDEEGIIIDYEKDRLTSYHDIQDMIRYDLHCDPYDKNIEYPDDFCSYIYDDFKIKQQVKIPKECYGFGNEIGIVLDENIDKISWEQLLMLYDFVYITGIDLLNNKVDSKFYEYVNECEKRDIPYGVLCKANINLFQNPKVEGYNDALTTSKLLKKCNPVLPTIYKVERSKVTEENKDNSFSYTIADFAKNETNPNAINSYEYLNELMTSSNYFRGNASVLYLDGVTSSHLSKLEEKILEEDEKPIFDSKLIVDEAPCPNSKTIYFSWKDNIISDKHYEFICINEKYKDRVYELNSSYKKNVRNLKISFIGKFLVIYYLIIPKYGLIDKGISYVKKRKKNKKETSGEK